MFWKKGKDANKVVWRDKNGKLTCPGDNCPKECDDTCPIWLNTEGLSLMMADEPIQAAESFQQALLLAPDFADAANNLGTAYGTVGNHQKAYEAFGKALALRKGYPQAIWGLIISSKNLEKYDEALQYCDEYDKLPGCNSSSQRAEIHALLSREEGDESDDDDDDNDDNSWIFLTLKLMDSGREEGYIQSTQFTHIPEVFIPAESVCFNLITELMEYQESDPTIRVFPEIYLLWSAFAGMGAVYFWNEDWPSLSETGILETLVKDRGIFQMDEFILDTIGIPFGSEQCEELVKYLHSLANECIDILGLEGTSLDVDSVVNGGKAMYAFGMVFEMNRLICSKRWEQSRDDSRIPISNTEVSATSDQIGTNVGKMRAGCFHPTLTWFRFSVAKLRNMHH